MTLLSPARPIPLLSLSLFPPAVLRPRGKISIWLLTYKMSGGGGVERRSCDQLGPSGRCKFGGKLVVHYSSFPPSLSLSLPSIDRSSTSSPFLPSFHPSMLSIAHFAASDPRQEAIAPFIPFLIEPAARSPAPLLRRPSRWCHFLPRWNASCSGRSVGRVAGQTNRNCFFSLGAILK